MSPVLRDFELAFYHFRVATRRLACKVRVCNDSMMAISARTTEVASTRDPVLVADIAVTRFTKLLERLLSGDADRAFAFDDLCTVLFGLGFTRRIRGSHHIFTRDGIRDILNLQPRRGGAAKPYQVRQVRDLVVRCGLALQLSLDEGADDEP